MIPKQCLKRQTVTNMSIPTVPTRSTSPRTRQTITNIYDNTNNSIHSIDLKPTCYPRDRSLANNEESRHNFKKAYSPGNFDQFCTAVYANNRGMGKEHHH